MDLRVPLALGLNLRVGLQLLTTSLPMLQLVPSIWLRRMGSTMSWARMGGALGFLSRGRRESEVRPVRKVHKVQQAPKETQGQLEQPALSVKLDQPAHKARLAPLVRKVPRARLARRAQPARRAIPEPRAPLEQRDQPGRKETRATQAPPDPTRLAAALQLVASLASRSSAAVMWWEGRRLRMWVQSPPRLRPVRPRWRRAPRPLSAR